MANIYSNTPKKTSEELIEILVASKNCRIERIISNGHATPEGRWYDQDKNELAFLLKGSAKLTLWPDKLVEVQEGDYIELPAHLKHRVEKASREALWLTVFY